MATIKELWNRMFNRSDELSLKKLLSCDKKGVTYLEQLCRSGQLDFNDEIFEQIKNSKEALYICAYFNRLSWLSSFSNEDVFFEKVDGNRLLIEFILEKDTTLDSNFLANFKKHPEVIDYVALYHPERLNQLSNDLIAKMFVSENGVFPVDKNINVIRQFILIPSVVPFDILLNYCKKKSNFDFFIGCSEELLLKDIGSGKILFEELLDRKIDTKYTFRDLKDPKLLNILVKKSRMNLLQFACNESLCLKYDEKNTYLDLLIAERSKNNNINIPFFNSFDNLSVESVAQIILIYARNGLIDKLPKIRVSTLLESRKDGKKTCLELMLEIDRETTLSKVLPNFKDITVEEAIKLNELGLDIKPKINFNSKISQGYAYNVSSNYDAGCSSEYDYLLDELYSLFAKDSKSSPALVEALIKSYRYLLSTENNFAVREVEQLIAIKKKFPEKFIYVFGQKPAFDCVTGNVILASLDIATINHETSHALHFYLTNNYFPEKYNEVATSVASNPKFKEKIANFAKEYDLVNNKISDIISSSGVEDYYSGTKLEELSQRLSAKKEEQKEKYRNRYPENVLDTLFERTYTVQEFISQRKKIEEAELEDKIMRAHFTGLMPISDIIDAISGGRLTSEGMRNSEGKLIDLSGHGMRYYDEPRARFKEIVAQYGTILKSKDANNSLHLLREVVGDELVDFVAGFYERMLKNTEFNLGTQSDKKVI